MKVSAQQSPVVAKRDWTLLYVLNGDNDLREAATLDLVNLDQSGSPDHVNVVAQLYRGELKWNLKNLGRKLAGLASAPRPTAVKNDWRGMRVFELRQSDSGDPTMEVPTPLATRSPSDPQALKDFVLWGMRNYPAENFAVILSGHGSQEGLMSDAAGKKMPFEEISQALQEASRESGQKLGVVLFDTCSTASDKTASIMQGSADYLVASPTLIRGGGWSEAATLDFLKTTPKATPRQLAESFLSDSHTAVPESTLFKIR